MNENLFDLKEHIFENNKNYNKELWSLVYDLYLNDIKIKGFCCCIACKAVISVKNGILGIRKHQNVCSKKISTQIKQKKEVTIDKLEKLKITV